MPAVSHVETLRDLVQRTKADELPALAGELARALAAVLERVAAVPPASVAPSASVNGPDTLLGVEQAAARLGVAPSWLYRHARRLPFTRKLGHRTLRFDARALDRWASTRTVSGSCLRP